MLADIAYLSKSSQMFKVSIILVDSNQGSKAEQVSNLTAAAAS